MKSYHGNYLGIVVQNNDPEKRGRVKIYIPHISPSIYAPWYTESATEDKTFKFPGKHGNNSALTGDIMDKLKEIVPWAECAMPLIGATGSGRYNAFDDASSISDTNKPETFIPAPGSDTSEYSLNTEGVGESPGRKYELQKLRLYDAFTKSDSDDGHDDPNKINILSYNYTPNTYSNKAKGSFSVPNVGSHIWCFFKEGDPTEPVYFAVSFGEEDWQSIYEIEDGKGYDYPGTFENKSNADDSASDLNTETYRNKFVINQKGGTLEFINTDNKEILKMTHYSGSFKEFTNLANIELATKNDQKLVLKDSFNTVRGYSGIFVGRDSDNLIKGDHFTKVGTLDRALHVQWRETAREIANVKQLFEKQRTDAITSDTYQRTSILQQKSGNPSLCPVCNDIEYVDWYWRFNSSFGSAGVSTTNNSSNEASSFSNVTARVGPATAQYSQRTQGGQIFGAPCPVCNGSGMSPSSMNGDYADDPNKQYTGSGDGSFEKLVKDVATKLKDIEKDLGRGGNQIVKVAKHKVETIGLAMNNFGSIRVDEKGKIYRDSVIVHPEGVFNSQAASPLVEYVHVDDLPGGTYTLNVANRWNAQIGAGGVSFKSYGPVDIGGTIVNVAGEQVNVTSQSEVNIDGGKRLTLVADILSIRQRNRKQVLVDSNLGVSQNVIIGGGLHVEGETTLHHVTAPCEIQETEKAKVFAKPTSAKIGEVTVTWTDPGGSATFSVFGTGAAENSILCYDHSHNFKNLPLTLKSDNDGVRTAGMECNKEQRVKPNQPQEVSADQKVT